MVFKWGRQQKTQIPIAQGSGKMDVGNSKDLEKQVKMIGLTIEDLARLNGIQPIINANIEELVAAFYSNTLSFSAIF